MSALGVGFEPTTSRLTVDRSTAELPQITQVFYLKPEEAAMRIDSAIIN